MTRIRSESGFALCRLLHRTCVCEKTGRVNCRSIERALEEDRARLDAMRKAIRIR